MNESLIAKLKHMEGENKLLYDREKTLVSDISALQTSLKQLRSENARLKTLSGTSNDNSYAVEDLEKKIAASKSDKAKFNHGVDKGSSNDSVNLHEHSGTFAYQYTIDQLNSQIDFLNSSLSKSEIQLKQRTTQVTEFNQKIIECQSEKDQILTLNTKLLSRLNQLESSLAAQQREIHEKTIIINSLETETKQLQDELLVTRKTESDENRSGINSHRSNVTHKDVSVNDFTHEFPLSSNKRQFSQTDVQTFGEESPNETDLTDYSKSELHNHVLRLNLLQSTTSQLLQTDIEIHKTENQLYQLPTLEEDVSKQNYIKLSRSIELENSLITALRMLKERDDSIISLQNRIVELENLLESFQHNDSTVTFNSKTDDIQYLQQKIIEYQELLNKKSSEITDLSDNLSKSLTHISNLERDISILKSKSAQSIRAEESNATSIDATFQRLVQHQNEFHESKQNLKDMESHLENLQVLVIQLESKLQSQQDRSNKLQMQLEQKEAEIKTAMAEKLKFNYDIVEKQQCIGEQEKLIHQFETTVSQLSKQVDISREEIERWKTNSNNLSAHIEHLTDLLARKDEEIKNHVGTITAHAQRTQSLENKCCSLSSEYAEHQKLFQTLQRLNASMTDDIILLTQENSQLTAELAQLSNEKEFLLKFLQDSAQKILNLEEESAKSFQEKTELIKSFQLVTAHKKQISDDLKSLEKERQIQLELSKKIEKNSSLKEDKISECQLVISQYRFQMAHMKSQLQELNELLNSQRTNSEILDKDNRKLLNELISVQETNLLLKDRIRILVRRAARFAEDSKVFQSRLSSIQRL